MRNALIEKLKTEAGQAGDLAMVATCDRALNGDEGARRSCRNTMRRAVAEWADPGTRIVSGEGADRSTGRVVQWWSATKADPPGAPTGAVGWVWIAWDDGTATWLPAEELERA